MPHDLAGGGNARRNSPPAMIPTQPMPYPVRLRFWGEMRIEGGVSLTSRGNFLDFYLEPDCTLSSWASLVCSDFSGLRCESLGGIILRNFEALSIASDAAPKSAFSRWTSARKRLDCAALAGNWLSKLQIRQASEIRSSARSNSRFSSATNPQLSRTSARKVSLSLSQLPQLDQQFVLERAVEMGRCIASFFRRVLIHLRFRRKGVTYRWQVPRLRTGEPDN